MKNQIDAYFCDALGEIISWGETVDTRNSTTKRLTGINLVFTETPLISIRRTAWRNAILEFEWFMSGSDRLEDLDEKVRHWWAPFSKDGKTLPYNYSVAFRGDESPYRPPIDQIQMLIDGVRNHPFSRRNVITTWIPEHVASGLINPTNCHGSLIQAFVDANNKLNLIMYQRSSDMLLGLPHNLIQYWAFLLWLAKQTGREIGTFQWIGGDCHVYSEHFELAGEMIAVLPQWHDSIETPELIYNGVVGDPFRAEDFSLSKEYRPIITKSAKMIV